MKNPGISIVIPAYNEQAFLPATLKSVRVSCAEFERQIGLPAEILVVNNASTDQTERVALENGAQVLFHEVRNISSVRNAGIRQAAYDVIVTIDADCFLSQSALSKIWEAIQSQNCIGGALGVRLLTDKWMVKIGAVVVQSLVRRISGIQGAMFFFLKDAALEVGGFSEQHLVAEDSVFALALRKQGEKVGRPFIFLGSVKVETLDRKEISLGLFFRLARQVWRGYRGAKQTPQELKFWYDPER